MKSFALLPLSLLGFSTSTGVGTNSVLFSIQPTSIVLSAIRPVENALALFLIIGVLTFISSAVSPGENSRSLHFVVHPETIIDSAIGPRIDTLSLNVVFIEQTGVGRAIAPCEFASSVFFS